MNCDKCGREYRLFVVSQNENYREDGNKVIAYCKSNLCRYCINQINQNINPIKKDNIRIA